MAGSLASELADGALVFARTRRYTLVDRPRVDLLADPTVERADIRVTARFADPMGSREPGVPVGASVGDEHEPGRGMVAGAHGPADTMVYTIPRPSAPQARLRVMAPDSMAVVHEFDGSALTIGRAADNDIVLPDPRVSRHHARVTGRRGTIVYTDLGSTNGSRVNGVAVGELVLGAGDRIQLGDSLIVVEVAGDVP
jgi:hypothetical protein